MSSEWKFLKIFFHARLTRMRRHISAIMLGITWSERWLGDGSAEVNQSLGLFFLWGYVKNIAYQVKINGTSAPGKPA
jgi:hypothetical protein